MRHKQEEQNGMQSLPPPQVPAGRHVQERFALRSQIELVQNPLPPPGAAATGWRQSGRRRQSTPTPSLSQPPVQEPAAHNAGPRHQKLRVGQRSIVRRSGGRRQIDQRLELRKAVAVSGK